MPKTEYLLKLWAKTSKTEDTAFHPLICHLIDVAAVTQKIWEKCLPPATKRRIATEFGEPESENVEIIKKIGILIAFVAGLHDLGKLSPPFQLRGKAEEREEERCADQLAALADKKSKQAKKLRSKLQTIYLARLLALTEFNIKGNAPAAKDVPHGFVTTIELPELLKKYGFGSQVAQQIGTLIGGHHGTFPDSDWNRNGRNDLPVNIGGEVWIAARQTLADELAQLLNVQPLTGILETKLSNAAVMILAGLVSVADWIGSDKQFFDCACKDFTKAEIVIEHGDLNNYLRYAEAQAELALKSLGWLGWQDFEKPKDFFELFPQLEKYPLRALQSEAVKIAEDLKSQGIVIVESPMGEGKTEAAMFLADIFNTLLGLRGIYFALPTQATSNQMFGRVIKFLTNRFERGNIQSMLVHGHSGLNEQFATLKEDFKRDIQGISDEQTNEETTAHVTAAEWFTARKRALLATFGVGTIDQALMAVLQTKHVFVRLFGLAHKTVIIDEVHAYDAYMSTLLERLLEWLAALGSPVILLSATLPKHRRDALVKAYLRGLGVSDPETVGDDRYPRISYATGSPIKVRHIATSTKKQTLHITKINEILSSAESPETSENFINGLKHKLRSGGCVAIICNTVARSQAVYEALSKDKFFQGNDSEDGKPKLNLLHSRFRFLDRNDIENNVRIRFGKKDDKIPTAKNAKGEPVKRPQCAVLVATQIIEQSLDIDFDLMISDFAPIDLLLQRAGRLFRHERERPPEFNKPELWLIKPETRDEMPDFGVHKYVYDEHILLRSWLVMRNSTLLEIPVDIEDLIQKVYDLRLDCWDRSFATYWDESKKRMVDKLRLKRVKAKTCRITDADDHDLFCNQSLELNEDNPEVFKTFQALTRDDEMPTVSVVILTQNESSAIDYTNVSNLENVEFLMKRESKISIKGLTHAIVLDENLKQKTWKNSKFLRHHRLLLLDENNKISINQFTVTLDEKLGIIAQKIGDTNEQI